MGNRMQRVTIVVGIEGVDPSLTEVRALVNDMVRDHMEAQGNDDYRVVVLDAEWDEGTIEWKASQINALLRVTEEVTKKCYASKPAKLQAVEMIEQVNAIAEAIEELAKKDDVKKSVDLTMTCAEVKTKVIAIHDHLVGLAYPSRKE